MSGRSWRHVPLEMRANRTHPSSHDRLADAASRARKAHKILTALTRTLGPELGAYVCLDIGCADGKVTRHLAERFSFTIGIEYSRSALFQAKDDASKRLVYLCGDGQALPLHDGAVDVVVCAQVYEHVPDAERLLREIWRVLTPGGACFFSGPNRLFPIELHTGLPLIHWLPFPWARACVRWLGRSEDYDIRPRTLWGLRRLARPFAIQDHTLEMLRDPTAYACEDELGPLWWVSRLPRGLLRAIFPFVPNYNWVLLKSSSG